MDWETIIKGTDGGEGDWQLAPIALPNIRTSPTTL